MEPCARRRTPIDACPIPRAGATTSAMVTTRVARIGMSSGTVALVQKGTETTSSRNVGPPCIKTTLGTSSPPRISSTRSSVAFWTAGANDLQITRQRLLIPFQAAFYTGSPCQASSKQRLTKKSFSDSVGSSSDTPPPRPTGSPR